MFRIFRACFALCVVGATACLVVSQVQAQSGPLSKTARRLFDQEQPESLGLNPIPGEDQILFHAKPESYKFCHQQNIGVYQDRLYVMWSNGIVHEDHNGQSRTRPMKTNLPDVTSRIGAGNLPNRTVFSINNLSHSTGLVYWFIRRRNPLCIALIDDQEIFKRAYVIHGETTQPLFRVRINYPVGNIRPRLCEKTICTSPIQSTRRTRV